MNRNDAQGLIRTHNFSSPLCHSTTAAQTKVALIQCDNNIFFRFYCKGGAHLLAIDWHSFQWVSVCSNCIFIYIHSQLQAESSPDVEIWPCYIITYAFKCSFFYFDLKKTKKTSHHRTSVGVYFLSVRITGKQTVWKTQKIPLPPKTV